MSLLGIDVGTSGCKAAAFSEDGQLLAAAYEEYDYQHPQPGWAELDTLQVWEQIKRTIRVAAHGTAHDPVKALCVSSLGEAVVPVTADRRILGPSLLNFDVRGAEYLAALRAQLADEQLYAINGNTLGNHYSLTKLLWLRDQQPDLYRQADRFLHWSGFVSFMLGAEAVVDYSLANRTLLFDLERHAWSDELIGLAQLDRDKLPLAVPSGVVIGSVAPHIAAELGLPARVSIVSGAHDQCCNGVGCGVIEPGRAMYGMGTYICMMPVFDRRLDAAAMIAQGLNTEHHAVPGQFVSFIYNQGGALVKWFRDTFAAVERQQAAASGSDLYAALIDEMPAEPSRVMVLPHFTATGPPQFITDSCGVIAGLHLDTARGEVLKGLIEATTFYLRECLETLPDGMVISDFRAAGGGSKSDAWLQICADILGRPVTRLQINEAGTLGAAIMAGTGSGLSDSLRDGVEIMVKLDRTFEPQPRTQRRYDERFEQYRKLWPLLREYVRTLAA
jgi:xylulokinase